MELRDCYERLGGDWDEVLGRLRTEARVEKFLRLFLEDESFGLLLRALEGGDRDGAFRAAHTLKGICQNLSFTRLYRSSAALTEALRGGGEGDVAGLLRQVREDYRQTAGAIRLLERDRNGGSAQ